MKKLILIAGVIASTTAMAQKDVNLNIVHHFDDTPFAYGTTFTTSGGTAVSFERVQYYLSSFELTHDGGQTTPLTGQYVLGSGNITNYTLGQADVTTVEALKFDLGVDYTANHQGTSNWTSPHPLAAQSPSMDWSWPSGYFFFVLDGQVDSNGDGTPDQAFQLRGIGDDLLRNVTPLTGMNLTGATIELAVDANVADWIKDIDLIAAGIDHSGGPNNVAVSDNTNDETVFTLNTTLSIEDVVADQSQIYANYDLPYAPTIFYQLSTKNPVDVKVFNMGGQLMMESKNQPYEGNYFIEKELNTGSYFIIFSNSEIEESFRFVVKR